MTPEPVRIDEIVPLERYRHVRDAYRQAVIEHKRQRRLPVGDKVTLVFEDHETLLFQIHLACGGSVDTTAGATSVTRAAVSARTSDSVGAAALVDGSGSITVTTTTMATRIVATAKSPISLRIGTQESSRVMVQPPLTRRSYWKTAVCSGER